MAFYLGENRGERLLLWPAISSGTILLERLTAKDESPLPIQPTQAEEQDRFIVERTDRSREQ
jgi:hypothetical protein